MAYDETLALRLREIFAARNDIIEKKMLGGIAFMLSGNMCCGVVNDTLMARVGPEQYEKALENPYAREMDFTGKPMKGFIYVAPAGIKSKKDLSAWVQLCISFAGSQPSNMPAE